MHDTRSNRASQLPYHEDGASVNYLASVPGGHSSRYVSHSLDPQGLRLYDVRACKLSNGPVQHYGAHSNRTQIQPRVAMVPDGFQLAAVDEKNMLRLWDLATGCVLACKQVGRTSPLAFRAAGCELLYVDEAGSGLHMVKPPCRRAERLVSELS